jgi:hypothetical protein
VLALQLQVNLGQLDVRGRGVAPWVERNRERRGAGEEEDGMRGGEGGSRRGREGDSSSGIYSSSASPSRAWTIHA